MTKSGTIAAVLGTDLIPPVVAFNEGYIAGAKSVNPKISISTYHPGEISQAFVDPEWGAATAKQAMDQGRRILVQAALLEMVLCRKSLHKKVFTALAWMRISGLPFRQHPCDIQRNEADYTGRC